MAIINNNNNIIIDSSYLRDSGYAKLHDNVISIATVSLKFWPQQTVMHTWLQLQFGNVKIQKIVNDHIMIIGNGNL